MWLNTLWCYLTLELSIGIKTTPLTLLGIVATFMTLSYLLIDITVTVTGGF